MSLTIDFILLFILIVIPGFLFKRFYFYGEFSKQFSTKDSVYKSTFYSFIPGILIQVSCFAIYTTLWPSDFNNIDVLYTVKFLLAKTNQTSPNKATEFINNGFSGFWKYELSVFATAILLGAILSRLVRLFKFDLRYKFLRFRNHWFYVFSGEINSLRKFRLAKKKLGDIESLTNFFSYYPPHVDILVNNHSGQALYSGYVIDYVVLGV